MPGPVAQWVVSPIGDSVLVSSILAGPHTFMEMDHEIYPLIQEGLLSVTSKSMCTEYSMRRFF